jgi:hypothetical protein
MQVWSGDLRDASHVRLGLESCQAAVPAHHIERDIDATVQLMHVIARMCGHDHLSKVNPEDLTTCKREMAGLSGVAYGPMAGSVDRAWLLPWLYPSTKYHLPSMAHAYRTDT